MVPTSYVPDGVSVRQVAPRVGVDDLRRDGSEPTCAVGLGDLLARYGARTPAPSEGFAMTCGTPGAIGGIRPSPSFRMELSDPLLGRSITHAYRCVTLPVIA
jgi:hypothetical protein